jgi:hypothetical protein
VRNIPLGVRRIPLGVRRIPLEVRRIPLGVRRIPLRTNKKKNEDAKNRQITDQTKKKKNTKTTYVCANRY